MRVTDIDGHEVIDAVGGLWNVNLGYSCEPVKQAIAAQLAELPYANIFRGVSNDKVIRLAHEVVDFFAPEGMRVPFHLWRIGLGGNGPSPRPPVSQGEWRAVTNQVPEPQERVSRHPFRRGQRQWQCQFSHPV